VALNTINLTPFKAGLTVYVLQRNASSDPKAKYDNRSEILLKSGIKTYTSEILLKSGIKPYTSEILLKSGIKTYTSEILLKSGIKTYTSEILL
jgi:hypothetical protein